MVITMFQMNFPQFLTNKYLEWQTEQGERKTVADFARYIGVKQSSISMWWNGSNTPSGESIRLLAQKFGLEVYDVLGLPRPDEDLAFITQNWDNVSPEFRSKFREEVEQHLAHEESKRVPKNRRARASS